MGGGNERSEQRATKHVSVPWDEDGGVGVIIMLMMVLGEMFLLLS